MFLGDLKSQKERVHVFSNLDGIYHFSTATTTFAGPQTTRNSDVLASGCGQFLVFLPVV